MPSTRLRFLGHSCLLIESSGKYILIDPFLTGNPQAALTADQVPADLILVSHGHNDHIGDTIAIAKRTGAKVVSNFEIGEWFEKQGLPADQVFGMQHGGGKTFDGIGRVKLTLAFHGSVLPDGTYGGNPAGLLITLANGLKIYDAADTGLFGDMALIGEEGLDLACLPIGDFYTMGPDDAVRATKMLRPKKVVPIHFNTFPPIEQDPNAWAAAVRKETQAEPTVLRPGEWLSLD